jgi:hypothetical protein
MRGNFFSVLSPILLVIQPAMSRKWHFEFFIQIAIVCETIKYWSNCSIAAAEEKV